MSNVVSAEKNCVRARAWYHANKDRARAANTAYKRLHTQKIRVGQESYAARNPQTMNARSTAARAKKKGIPCDVGFLMSMECPAHCPILETPISFRRGEGHRPFENTASFDQIVPGRGYIRGNVRIISKLANMMLIDATPEQRIKFAQWILSCPR